MLSTITWNGSGDGTTFNSGANWVGAVASGASDVAVINVSNGVTIKFPAGGITVDSITQTGGTLSATSGTITTTLGISLTNATLNNVSG